MNEYGCRHWLSAGVIVVMFSTGLLPLAISAEESVPANPEPDAGNNVEATAEEPTAQPASAAEEATAPLPAAQAAEPETPDVAAEQTAPVAAEGADPQPAASVDVPTTPNASAEQTAPVAAEGAAPQPATSEDKPESPGATAGHAGPAAAEKTAPQDKKPQRPDERERQDQINELQQLLAEQSRQLETQRSGTAEHSRELGAQQALVAAQQIELDQQQAQLAQQQSQIETQTSILQAMQTQLDQFGIELKKSRSDDQVAMDARLRSLETSVAEIPESPDISKEFDRSIGVPGTNSAFRIGGFVKMSLVDSLDPIGSEDRFITGSIPPSGSMAGEEDGQFAVSARQSRVNIEEREQTRFGVLRAFVEGDFAGNGDTFRLRHAFGQFRHLLAGKTWSNMVDTVAVPEEVDFEGINGRLQIRHPQFRYFPPFGQNSNFIISLEDPNPDVTGGDGKSQWPDVAMSIDRTLFEGWRAKTSVLLRQIEAQSTENPMGTKSAFGWGASVSAKVGFGFWDERDNFMFQFNIGDGLGRYINDLGSVGGQDAVFNPVTGELETLKVLSGYVSVQHWWAESMRSTLTYSWVDVDNLSFQLPGDYNRTKRASINFIWSPIRDMEIGTEFLWGQRVNNDLSSGKAKQIQIATTYRF